MMKVIIATLKNFPECANSCNFQIHEKSIFLTGQQQRNLKSDDVTWVEDIDNANSNPTIFLANEFFDALPIKQFICKQNIWYEKYIINKGKSFKFVDQKIKKSTIEKLLKQKILKNQKFIEFSPLGNEILGSISKIIKKNNGGILIIDYGYKSKKMFNTLQSIKGHKKRKFTDTQLATRDALKHKMFHFLHFSVTHMFPTLRKLQDTFSPHITTLQQHTTQLAKAFNLNLTLTRSCC